jgi:hypothetical protein
VVKKKILSIICISSTKIRNSLGGKTIIFGGSKVRILKLIEKIFRKTLVVVSGFLMVEQFRQLNKKYVLINRVFGL